YYACPDGTQVNYCKMVIKEGQTSCVDTNGDGINDHCSSGGGGYCLCDENPSNLCKGTSGVGGNSASTAQYVCSHEETKTLRRHRDPCDEARCKSGTLKECKKSSRRRWYVWGRSPSYFSEVCSVTTKYTTKCSTNPVCNQGDVVVNKLLCKDNVPINESPCKNGSCIIKSEICKEGSYQLTKKEGNYYFGAQRCNKGVWTNV
ncbi:hypothetical protein GOV08_01375, partial [Candidatus Woesearchaeota archaeon]|nr:hypothetical protein [Candidatus Woesearchaeota archaeon]